MYIVMLCSINLHTHPYEMLPLDRRGLHNLTGTGGGCRSGPVISYIHAAES